MSNVINVKIECLIGELVIVNTSEESMKTIEEKVKNTLIKATDSVQGIQVSCSETTSQPLPSKN